MAGKVALKNCDQGTKQKINIFRFTLQNKKLKLLIIAKFMDISKLTTSLISMKNSNKFMSLQPSVTVAKGKVPRSTLPMVAKP